MGGETLELISASGGVYELKSPRTGYRYGVLVDDGEQRFSIREMRKQSKAARAEVKVCCKKFHNAFGVFLDRSYSFQDGPVCIFPKETYLSNHRNRRIRFCPWCGRKVRILGNGSGQHKL